jgi:hypothetical protein
VREVGRFDAGRYAAIACWPLRELLISYVALIRELAEEGYRHAQLLYQVRNAFGGGKEEPPPPPPLLRDPPQK